MKTKVKFQSSEEFMQDYDAYKQGKSYKILYTTKGTVKSKYVSHKYVSYRTLKFEVEFLQETNNFIDIVDLKHKFEVVCKVA